MLGQWFLRIEVMRIRFAAGHTTNTPYSLFQFLVQMSLEQAVDLLVQPFPTAWPIWTGVCNFRVQQPQHFLIQAIPKINGEHRRE